MEGLLSSLPSLLNGLDKFFSCGIFDLLGVWNSFVGVMSKVHVEGGEVHGRVNSVVVAELTDRQPFCPLIRGVVNKYCEQLFDFLIDSF